MRDLEWKADDVWKRKEADWADQVRSLPEDARDLIFGLVGRVKSDMDLFKGKADSHQMRLFFLILRRGLTLPSWRIGDAQKYSRLSGDYSSRFSLITGMTPLEFLNSHRARLAQEILRHVDLPKYMVAYVVGLPDQSILCRIYKKYIGYRPSDEPRASQNQTRQLLEQFRNPERTLDPRVSENTAEVTIVATGTDLPTFWEQAKGLERGELTAYLIGIMPDISIEHFFFLLEKAKYEGRRNRIRGEELALCALDALRLLEIRHGEFYFDEMAIGCATVANSCRLQLKFDEAVIWFQHADIFLPRNREDNPLLYANVDLLRSSLLWWRKRIEEALSLLSEILPVVREHGSHHLLARALLLTADIYDSCGHSDRAVPLLREALEFAQYRKDPYSVHGGNFCHLSARDEGDVWRERGVFLIASMGRAWMFSRKAHCILSCTLHSSHIHSSRSPIKFVWMYLSGPSFPPSCLPIKQRLMFS